jgi:hypothetical protein
MAGICFAARHYFIEPFLIQLFATFLDAMSYYYGRVLFAIRNIRHGFVFHIQLHRGSVLHREPSVLRATLRCHRVLVFAVITVC